MPTFLELAGLPPVRTDGVSLVPLLRNPDASGRDSVFLERERHANVRRGDLGYPVRAIRTREFLYVWNLRPERNPSGDAEHYFAVGPYGDVDASLTKELLLTEPRPSDLEPYFQRIFGRRPAEELYDLRTDPDQVRNLADDPASETVRATLRRRVEEWMQRTDDPRCDAADDRFDTYPYYGKRSTQAAPAGKQD